MATATSVGAPATCAGDESVSTSTRFSIVGLTGEINDRFVPDDLEGELLRIIDPSSATRTVHWGRNYLYEARMRCACGEQRVVIKTFRNQTAAQRAKRRWRGSEAIRTWRVSQAMVESGIPTPDPVAVLDSIRLDGPSFFVSQLVDGLEARYLFRAMNTSRTAELFPEIDVDAFLSTLGQLLRRLHDSRFWHRDVSAGNLILAAEESRSPEKSLYLLDLNRTRIGKPLSRSERMRDLSRLPIFVQAHRDRLLESYWAPELPKGQQLYLFYQHGFLAKNRIKKALRGLTNRAKRLLPRTRHAHIELADEGASARNRSVWDGLTEQPHQHAGRWAKMRIRLSDAGIHLQASGPVLRRVPAIVASYRRIRAGLEEASAWWGDPGVCLTAGSGGFAEVEAALDGLRTRRVMLRLSPWESDLGKEQEMAQELHRRGYDLALSVPQNRDLVRDPGRWRSRLEEIEDRFLSFASDVQVGHAINRSKWGVWTTNEHEVLIRIAAEVLRKRPGIRLLGPAVIDFEFLHTAAALNSARIRFDVVTSLLYVDRRGAPENRQMGFDTVAKVALLKAIVATSVHGDRPCWITEVNWPLAEGPHSPAGRAVAVGEEAQADYLVRYYLLTLATGLIERVYWWQLVARGYGLTRRCGEGLFLRPSYRALAHMAQRLVGTRIHRLATDRSDVYLYLARRPDGSELIVGWVSRASSVEVSLPRSVRESFDRDGARLSGARGAQQRLSESPVYFELASP